jgi:L-amino acid N-acyltransferase YncA
MEIVDAAAEHLEGIARIYRYYVETSPATFDLIVPDPAYWRQMLGASNPDVGHYLLVALDDDGEVLAYAKSGKFRERAAYDTTCETSIYVDPNQHGKGIGQALYGRLIDLLEASPLRLAVGGMTEPNPASAALHESLGFTKVGTFEGVGVKFDQPWDVTWYSRPLV